MIVDIGKPLVPLVERGLIHCPHMLNALVLQPGNQVTPDESATASDQYVFHRFLPLIVRWGPTHSHLPMLAALGDHGRNLTGDWSWGPKKTGAGDRWLWAYRGPIRQPPMMVSNWSAAALGENTDSA